MKFPVSSVFRLSSGHLPTTVGLARMDPAGSGFRPQLDNMSLFGKPRYLETMHRRHACGIAQFSQLEVGMLAFHGKQHTVLANQVRAAADHIRQGGESPG